MKMKTDKLLIELKKAVDAVEIVDAHAHNVVAIDSDYPFLKCFSDANGDALYNAPYTFNFKRCLRELTELYGPSLSLSLGLHTVQETRRSLGLEQSAITCFRAARICTVLIDDGVDQLDKMVDIEWHKRAVPMVGRILRVERLAEKILDKGSDGATWTLDSFMEIFTKELKSVADKVVAFKSMIACRSGLAINTEVTKNEAEEGLSDVLRAGNTVRISNKSFIDYIFMHALEVAQSYDLAMQIHMGFGDKDFDMMLANPLYLHNLLEDKRFTNSRLVLLHATYPFSKEASHLASAYPQVYLDFGFAIPKLSFHGMISSVKELLKLAPMNKVMFSTDAIAFAEAFYLGARRAREVVFSVLRDAMVEGDLSITKAVAAVKDIFAENAKKLYKLHKLDVSSKDSDEPHISSLFMKEELHGSVKDSSTESDVEPYVSSSFQNEELNGSSKDVTLVRMIWIDASGQHRCRGVPRQRFCSFVKKHGIGLPRACMGISSVSDSPVEDTNLTCSGLITIVPDLSTKCRIPWAKQQEMVLSDMCTKSGEAWEYCPREALRRISQILKDEFGLVMTAGFEVEFYLLESVIKDDKEEFESSDKYRRCHTSAFDIASPMLEEMLTYLQALNISVDYLHKEAGKGQFEIGLEYTEDCFGAADRLIYTREVIRTVGRKYGFHPTFLPKYSLDEYGCGSNVHISLSKNGINVFKASDGSSQYGISKTGEAFMSGVLDHLPSVFAFTAPHPTSYERLFSKDWNGRVISWQKENAYAKISTCKLPGADVVSHFVCPAFDACTNPYLGLASIMTAGIDGLRKNLSLPAPVDRETRGVNQEDYRRLPDCLTDSLNALEEDTLFNDMMGENLVVCIKAIRKAEINHYSEDDEPYKDLIYKY